MGGSRRFIAVALGLALCVSLTPVLSAAGGGVSPLAGPSLTWQLASGVATVAAGAVSASDDGARVAFCANDAYVVDTDGMSATRASVSPIGDAANAQVGHTALSGDGAVVAFATSATNTVLSDANGETDVFARDLVTNTTGLVSLTNGGAQADLWSIFPDVSDTGRYVSFQSNADNLSSFDNNDMSNLYVRDRVAGTTTLVNGYRDGNSWDIELADSGTTGVFVTAATNFPGVTDLNGQLDVVVWGGGSSYTVVSATPGGTPGNGASDRARISGGGSTIAFESAASNISLGDTNGKRDIFLWSSVSGVTRVDNGVGGAQLNGDSTLIDLSGDARFVLFSTSAANAPEGPGLYVRDLQAALPVYLGAALSPSALDGDLGASGDFVVVATTAALGGGDGDALADVYITFADFAAPTAAANVAARYDAGGGPMLTASDNNPGSSVLWRYGLDATQSAPSPGVATVPTTAGVHTLTYWAVDAAGNVGRPSTTSVTVGDTRAPESDAGVVPGSFDGTATINITATDPAIGTGSSGVAGIEWWTDAEGYASGTAPGASASLKIARAGARTLYWRAYDNAGNYEAQRSVSFTVRDIDAPLVDIWEQPQYGDRAQIPVFADDTFNGVGPSQMQYKVDGGTSQYVAIEPDGGGSFGFGRVYVTGLGVHDFEARVEDFAGNWSGWQSAQFTIVDDVEPTITMAERGKGPGESTLVYLSATDGGYSPSGVTSLEWRVDGGTTQTVSGTETTVTVSGAGDRTLAFWALDAAGNRSPGNQNTIRVVEAVAPYVVISVDRDATPILASFYAVDPGPNASGVQRIRWTVNGSIYPAQNMGSTGEESFADPGTYTLEVWAFDNANNESAHETTQIVVPDDPGGGGGEGGGAVVSDAPVLNSGANWSTSTVLSVESSATGATKMRFALSESALDAAAWVPYARLGAFTVPGDGLWPVWSEYADETLAHVSGRLYDQIGVDRVAPVTTSNATENRNFQPAEMLYFTADDPSTGPNTASNVSATYYRIDGGTVIHGTSHQLGSPGSYTVQWWSTDHAGNTETVHSKAVTVAGEPLDADLVMGAAPGTVTYPGKVTISAGLKESGSGTALVGRSIVVESSANGSTGWTTVAAVATGPGGAATYAAAPSATCYYRLRFAGDVGYRATTTAAQKVTVKASLSTPVMSSTVYKGKTFKVYSYVKPKHTSGVYFRCYRYESGKWIRRKTVSVKYATYNSTTSKVYQSTTLPYKGTWRIYTYHSDSGHYSPAYSGYKKVTVK